MPHYRTIHDAAVHYREQDPGTAITENLIRQLVVSGVVPSAKAGRKYLVALEALDAHFQSPSPINPPSPARARQVWQIR